MEMALEQPSSANQDLWSSCSPLSSPKGLGSSVFQDRAAARDKLDAGLEFDLEANWRETLTSYFLRALALERGQNFAAGLINLAEKGTERRTQVDLDAASVIAKGQRTLSLATLEALDIDILERSRIPLLIEEACRLDERKILLPFLRQVLDGGRNLSVPIRENWFHETQLPIFIHDLELAGFHKPDIATIVRAFINGRIARNNIEASRVKVCSSLLTTCEGNLAFIGEKYDQSLEEILFRNGAKFTFWFGGDLDKEGLVFSKRPSAIDRKLRQVDLTLLCNWLFPETKPLEVLGDGQLLLPPRPQCRDAKYSLALVSNVSLRYDNFARALKIT